MKRFAWPLERLLDVRRQQENAMRSELSRLAEQQRLVRQELERRQEQLRSRLAELAAMELTERLVKQELFMRFSALTEREIRKLRERLESLEQQRKETLRAFQKLRQARKTLERLREEAMSRHIREQMRLEQMHLDEIAQAAFCRKANRPQEVLQ